MVSTTPAVALLPRQYSTGGCANLLGISKRADKNLRRLLVQTLAYTRNAWSISAES